MKDFKKLKVWKKAHQLTIAVYKASQTFPTAELYGLTSQLRGAGIAITANIAEGCGRGGYTELVHFLNLSMGEAVKFEYLLLLCQDLNMIEYEQYELLNTGVNELKRVLASFVKRLTADS